MKKQMKRLASLALALAIVFGLMAGQMSAKAATSDYIARLQASDFVFAGSNCSGKKSAMISIAENLLNAGYEPAFVAGVMANVSQEGTFGKFENITGYTESRMASVFKATKISDGGKTHQNYVAHMCGFTEYDGCGHSHKSEYSVYNNKYVYNGFSLSAIKSLLEQYQSEGWKARFGLGSIQWTSGRTLTLVNEYIKAAGGADTITAEQCARAEMNMIVYELQNTHKSVYTNWCSANSDRSTEAAAYDAGSRVCLYYEVPADKANKAVTRGNIAKAIFAVMVPTVDLSNYSMDFTISNTSPVIGSSITVSWNAVQGATGYYLSGWTAAGQVISLNVDANTTSYSYTIPNGDAISFTIVPFNNSSRASDSVLIRKSITPYRDLTNYRLDFNISNTAPVIGSSITVSWNAVQGATGYYLSGWTATEEHVIDLNVDANTTSYTYTIPNGDAISFTIVPFNNSSRASDSVLIRKTITPSGYSGTCGTNLTWNLSSAGTLTISGTGAMIDIDRDELGKTPWKEYNSLIKEVVLKSGVTSIGDGSFSECSSLTSISIPNSVTSIGEYAFFECSSLTSISIPNSVTSIGEDAFSECSSLTSISIPDSVTSIGAAAFFDCHSLTSVSLGSGVESIGDYVFQNCISLTSIRVASGNTAYTSKDDILYNKAMTKLVCCPAAKTGEVIIPDSVTSIGLAAFMGCESLTSISLPAGVTDIGMHAFHGCSSLTSINIPNGVTSIADYTFSFCNSLTSVSLPVSVTNIWNFAFMYCDELTDIYYAGTENQWNDIEIYSWGNDWLYNATIHFNSQPQVSIVASGTCGDNATWTYDASTATLTISGKGSMSNYWFNENQSGYTPWYGHRTTIKKVVIGEGITYIGNYSFYDMSNLTEVVLPTTLLSTGAGAFESCKSLQSISFPNGFLDIGGYAFFNDTNLKTVVLPFSLRNVYDCAFRNCDALTLVQFKGTADKWANVYVSEEYNSSFINSVQCLASRDINKDGVTDLKDVSVLYRIICGIQSISGCNMSVSDVDGDGENTLRDVAVLYNQVTGR